MATRDLHRPGAPCWIDLFTSDPETSTAFYGHLFGWKAESAGPEYGGYRMLLLDDTPVAGCMVNDGSAGTPDGWSTYLAVADLDATAEAATRHGGQVLVPPMDVMALGRMGLLADVGGAAVGAWQAGEFAGFELTGRSGEPAWFELHTRAYAAAVSFYTDVFGWDAHTASDEPDFRYTTLGQGDEQLAGIMDATDHLPDGVPAHWAVYVRVPDVDATLEQAVALGATVRDPATDTPFGRLAQLADPTGAVLRLTTP